MFQYLCYHHICGKSTGIVILLLFDDIGVKSALLVLVLVPLSLHSHLDVELMARPMFSYHFSSYWHLALHVDTGTVA